MRLKLKQIQTNFQYIYGTSIKTFPILYRDILHNILLLIPLYSLHVIPNAQLSCFRKLSKCNLPLTRKEKRGVTGEYSQLVV